MQPKVELTQTRNFGEITDDSILFLKQNYKPLFKAYFAICGFFWVSGLIIAAFNQTQAFRLQEQGESIYSITYFFTMFLTFVNFIFISLTALSFIALYREKGNEAPGVDEIWSYVKFYLIRVFSSAVLLTILLAIGLVFCILPGIYFLPVFLLIITIMVLENASLSYAFNRAFQLIKQKWWQTFGVLLVMAIIIFAAMVLLAIPVTIIVYGILLLTTTNHQHIESLALTLTLHAIQFLYLLPVISMAFVYFNLNEQKDDNSLMQRIEMLGKSSETVNQLPSEEY